MLNSNSPCNWEILISPLNYSEIQMLMILLMMARQAYGQMRIKEDAEGDIDAAAYAAEYADADAVTVHA